MKRGYEDEERSDVLFGNDMLPRDAHTFEKRSRCGGPPMIVGPFVYDESGTKLQQALFKAEPSSLPGVHRLAATENTIIRLWSPQWPQQTYLETSLPTVLHAVNEKCIFIFDTRKTFGDKLLGETVSVDWLLTNPVLRRSGVIVSKHAPPLVHNSPNPLMPFIQDPVGFLAILCHFYDYLGSSAVFVKNGEVVATTMLSRTPENLRKVFDEWSTY